MLLLDKIDAQMNYILLLIKQMPKSSRRTFNKSLTKSAISSSSSPVLILREDKHLLTSSSKNNNQLNNFSQVLEDHRRSSITTSDNFPFSHLCNRDIRDLPLLQRYNTDFDRLRSYYILTMTDLIGRYLVHKTPDHFREFLIEKVQCSRAFTDELIQLLDSWTRHNLKVARGARTTTTLKQYL